ncbi:MAG: hypothetical protein AAGF26_10785 [Cyanobacteria bacterium P01_G01_bin.49]
MKLGEILVKNKLITPETLRSVLERQPSNLRLGQFLLKQHLISLEALESALMEQFWRLNGYWVIDQEPTQSVELSIFPSIKKK